MPEQKKSSDAAARFAPFDAPTHFGYFVLQLRAARRAGALEVTGVLENLANGDKRAFARAEHVTHLIRDWGLSATDAAHPAAALPDDTTTPQAGRDPESDSTDGIARAAPMP